MIKKKKEIEILNLNATEITLDKANFIYKEIRDYLDGTIDGLKSLQRKCTLLLAFVFSFCSVFVLNNNGFTEELRNYLFRLSIIYLFIAFFVVWFVYLPEERHIPGNEPKNLLIQGYIDNKLPMMILTEASSYQYRIDENIKTLTKWSKALKFFMLALISAPPLLYIGSAIIWFFSGPKICSF